MCYCLYSLCFVNYILYNSVLTLWTFTFQDLTLSTLLVAMHWQIKTSDVAGNMKFLKQQFEFSAQLISTSSKFTDFTNPMCSHIINPLAFFTFSSKSTPNIVIRIIYSPSSIMIDGWLTLTLTVTVSPVKFVLVDAMLQLVLDIGI